MAISSNIRVSSEVDNYTLAELLDTLGSPKKVKDVLSNLETASKKADKATKALTKAENTRDNAADADNRKREKEINAIHKDKEALAAAWDKLSADTAAHNAANQAARKDLRRDQEAFAAKEAALAKQSEALENTRKLLDREQANTEGLVAEARKDAMVDRAAAEKAKEDAKRLNTEANCKMANMRKLVA
tara:strand:- start:701 stop:1267 length:567 start_codon:yes stop_codon:yes gene_type:complete